MKTQIAIVGAVLLVMAFLFIKNLNDRQREHQPAAEALHQLQETITEIKTFNQERFSSYPEYDPSGSYSGGTEHTPKAEEKLPEPIKPAAPK